MRDLKIFPNSNESCGCYETDDREMETFERLGEQVNIIPKELGSLKENEHSHLIGNGQETSHHSCIKLGFHQLETCLRLESS